MKTLWLTQNGDVLRPPAVTMNAISMAGDPAHSPASEEPSR